MTGTEGMFEDIHELDTARIDELHLGASNSVKSLLAMKLCGGDSNAGSSNGSVTSASSNNTPRSSHFDFFWIEQNNPSEQEDINQVFLNYDLFVCHGVCNSVPLYFEKKLEPRYCQALPIPLEAGFER